MGYIHVNSARRIWALNKQEGTDMKILRVDITNEKMTLENLKEEWTSIGGSAFIAKIMNQEVPPAPFILAMILGPMLERSLQQSLIASGGNLFIFVEKPISAILLCVGAFLILTPVLKRLWKPKQPVQIA